MGAKPVAEELARRGRRIPVTQLGQPNTQGDLSKAEIRRTVKANLKKIAACYEKALAINPALEGTLQTQFFITPSGSVNNASASGIDVEVSTCVAAVLKTLEFPAPKGGGGVQVNYPFLMRP